jgi:cob(I)alamin adenosyltransferase
MSISTQTGDNGTSALLFNRRVPKTDAHIEACGAVDELNAALGLARAASGPSPLNVELLQIQNELVILMGELALLDEDRPKYEQRGGQYISPAATDRLTAAVHEAETTISFKDWAMPGATQLGAALDFARTVCRRAERRVLLLREIQPTITPETHRYLNRLSDLLCLRARQADTPLCGPA